MANNPSISVALGARVDYLDEADRFYSSPKEFLEKHFPTPPSKGRNPNKRMLEATTYQWPDRLVFFGALEDTIKDHLGKESRYNECKRFFNTHFHDDRRRKGDVIVYCLENEVKG